MNTGDSSTKPSPTNVDEHNKLNSETKPQYIDTKTDTNTKPDDLMDDVWDLNRDSDRINPNLVTSTGDKIQHTGGDDWDAAWNDVLNIHEAPRKNPTETDDLKKAVTISKPSSEKKPQQKPQQKAQLVTTTGKNPTKPTNAAKKSKPSINLQKGSKKYGDEYDEQYDDRYDDYYEDY